MPSRHRAVAPGATSAFWPREHGAYVQLLAPLLSAFWSAKHVPLAACLALGPFALLAAALQLHVYRPRTPKGLGWALTVANLGAVVLFGMTLPHSP